MQHHAIGHVELSAENSAESGKFYQEVFGWKIATREHDYVTFEGDGGFRGGFADAKEPTYERGRVLVYLATEDIDASLAAIESYGGSIEQTKVVIPQIGEWAIFTDPAGNLLGLWKATRTRAD